MLISRIVPVHRPLRSGLTLLLLMVGRTGSGPAAPPRIIAGFDSSVCNGYGDHLDRHETEAERFGVSSRVVPTDERLSTTLALIDGVLVYRGLNRAEVRSVAAVNDGRWCQVAIAYRAAASQTLIYLDDRLVSTIKERLVPDTSDLGGGAAFEARDWFVYRSAFSAYDVAALADGMMIHSSLEVYAPLHDGRFETGATVESRALKSFTGFGPVRQH